MRRQSKTTTSWHSRASGVVVRRGHFGARGIEAARCEEVVRIDAVRRRRARSLRRRKPEQCGEGIPRESRREPAVNRLVSESEQRWITRNDPAQCQNQDHTHTTVSVAQAPTPIPEADVSVAMPRKRPVRDAISEKTRLPRNAKAMVLPPLRFQWPGLLEIEDIRSHDL